MRHVIREARLQDAVAGRWRGGAGVKPCLGAPRLRRQLACARPAGSRDLLRTRPPRYLPRRPPGPGCGGADGARRGLAPPPPAPAGGRGPPSGRGPCPGPRRGKPAPRLRRPLLLRGEAVHVEGRQGRSGKDNQIMQRVGERRQTRLCSGQGRGDKPDYAAGRGGVCAASRLGRGYSCPHPRLRRESRPLARLAPA